MSETNHFLAALLNPLSRARIDEAFGKVLNVFNFTPKEINSTRVWDLMFKDDTWFQAINDIDFAPHHPPNPTLVGYDLKSLYDGSSTSAYIVLLLSDWSGDGQWLSEKLFASLREHDYNKRTCEVRFKNSDIILNIRDALINYDEWLVVEDPKRLFHCHENKLQTAALYFQDKELHEIGPHEIGKVDGISTEEEECIKYICSIRLKFGNGMPVYQVIQQREIPMNLVNVQTTDENGEKWVTSWRLARTGEREWWP